jgi:hypothetical protein
MWRDVNYKPWTSQHISFINLDVTEDFFSHLWTSSSFFISLLLAAILNLVVQVGWKN